MPRSLVYISKETHALIRSKALLPFKHKGVQHEDGGWSVPINEEVIAKLQRLSFKGETMSDTIFRVLSFNSGFN